MNKQSEAVVQSCYDKLRRIAKGADVTEDEARALNKSRDILWNILRPGVLAVGREAQLIEQIRSDPFTHAYLVAALWIADNNSGSGEWQEHAGYYLEDIAPSALTQAIADCERFKQDFGSHFQGREADAGHDFYLTRNGHGAGFWDGDWSEPIGVVLADAASKAGPWELYRPLPPLVVRGKPIRNWTV